MNNSEKYFKTLKHLTDLLNRGYKIKATTPGKVIIKNGYIDGLTVDGSAVKKISDKKLGL